MKMKYTFESVNMGDEIIMVPVGNGASQVQGVIKLNETGYKIVQMISQGMTEDEIVNSLMKEYSNDRDTLTRYVQDVINILKDNQFVE